MYISHEISRTVGKEGRLAQLLRAVPGMMDCLPYAMRPFLETSAVTRVDDDVLHLTFNNSAAFSYCSKEEQVSILSRVASAMCHRPIRIRMHFDARLEAVQK